MTWCDERSSSCPPDQVDALDEWCRREGVSRAEAVRRAVAEHLSRRHISSATRAFGLWRDLAEDGLAYQERLRRDWDARDRDQRNTRDFPADEPGIRIPYRA